MLTVIRRLLTPPVYDDPELARKARLLNSVLMSLLGIILLAGPLFFIMATEETRTAAMYSLGTVTVVVLGLTFMMRRGRVQLAYNLLVGVLTLFLVANGYFLKMTAASAAAFVIVVLLAALLISSRAAILMSVICNVLVFGLYFILGENSVLEPRNLVPIGAMYVLIALLLRLAVNNTDEALQLAHRNERALAQSNQELEAARAMLEQRVSERTRDLTVSVEISRRLSTILDPQQLVREIVEQVQTAFDYYHVHIYLFDDKQESLVMVGGTGEAGQTMLAAGHRLERGRGLVGRAAEMQRVVLVSDVSQEPAWLPNPLLPETRAEMAVPIAIGGHVLGVLDIQHNVTGGLQEKDTELVQSLASQVAVALQNARLYSQAQLQAERETFLNSISQRIQRATSIEAALQIAAEELGRTTGASRATVQLTSPVRLSNGRSQQSS